MVGLTPEDVGKALNMALKMEEFAAAREAAPVEARYKRALTKQAEAAAERPFTIPGTDIKLSSKEARLWYTALTEDDRTAAAKTYEYYEAREKAAGRIPKPIDTWNKQELSAKEKHYERAVKEGYEGTFHEWNLEMAKAGALTITDLRERKELGEEVKGEAYFMSPKFMGDVTKQVDSEREQEIALADDPTLERSRQIISETERRLSASGYVESWTAERAADGTLGWTVKFKSGKTTRIGFSP